MIYTVTGQLITVIASFVLTRVYSPIAFGLMGLLMSFSSLVGNAFSLNFHAASPAPPRDEDGAIIAIGSLPITVVMSVLLSLVFLGLVITGQMGFGALPRWSALLILGQLLLTGIASILQYWCVRRQKFQRLGEGIVAMNVSRAAFQLGFSFFAPTWIGLVLGEMFGRLIQFLLYLRASGRELYGFRKAAVPHRIVSTLSRYRKFATVLLPPMFLESAWAAVPVPLFSILFGLSITGQYYLTRRVLDLPVAFISSTVGDAFYGKISEFARTDPGRIRGLLVTVFCGLVAVAAIGFAPLMLFGPTLFSLIFGEPWRQAGLMAALMVPPMVLQIGTSPVARVFGVTKKPALRYPFTISEIIGASAAFFAAWVWHLSAAWTVALLSIAHVISYLVYITAAYIAAGHIDSQDDLPPDLAAASE
jgi:O-antigen/teichoic acid export membrane protein